MTLSQCYYRHLSWETSITIAIARTGVLRDISSLSTDLADRNLRGSSILMADVQVSKGLEAVTMLCVNSKNEWDENKAENAKLGKGIERLKGALNRKIRRSCQIQYHIQDAKEEIVNIKNENWAMKDTMESLERRTHIKHTK